MRRRFRKKTRLLLSSGALAAALALAFALGAPKEPHYIRQLRQSLKRDGLKISLDEFDFSTAREVRDRVAPLTNSLMSNARATSQEDFDLRRKLQEFQSEPAVRIGTNSAVLKWQQNRWPITAAAILRFEAQDQKNFDYWAELRDVITRARKRTVPAMEAALSGEIRYSLDAKKGYGILLPHLSAHKEFAGDFSLGAILELHDGNMDAAWTNVLAATRMVTAWTPAPLKISLLVRCACTRLAFDLLWQSLPAGWSEDRLAMLQKEWEGADFLHGIPETAAYERASAAALCRAVREEPISPGVPASQLIRDPRSAWSAFVEYTRQNSYRHRGSYEDERDLLLYFRDRELSLKRAMRARTWAEMRAVPGATNIVAFHSKHASRVQAVLNLKEMLSITQQRAAPGAGSSAAGILADAADAEARRRIITAAIALERYRARHGSYPRALGDLVPEFSASLPIDFMDGLPLRYGREGSSYLLYSAGLDCADNGGVFPRDRVLRNHGAQHSAEPADLIWPAAASPEQIAAFAENELKRARDEFRQRSEQESEWHWVRTAERQKHAEELLRAKQTAEATGSSFGGKPLTEILRGEKLKGMPVRSVEELLVLKPRASTNLPEVVVFDLPVRYDALTNAGRLELLIDPIPGEFSDTGPIATAYGLGRAPDGDTELVWSTIYETPGIHALQLVLLPASFEARPRDISGPLQEFTITNLCQVSPSSARVSLMLGTVICGKLAELNGTVSAEFYSRDGKHLKTLQAHTSNGSFAIAWDLNTESSTAFKPPFTSILHIVLSESKRSQALRLSW